MHRSNRTPPCPRRAAPRLRQAWLRWRRAHRESRGFTLTEMVVTMFLATMIAIGAFHIHATFQSSLHRQDEITRIQGTMKVTRMMLERKIRPAGAGMTGIVMADCGGTHQVGPFVIHNANPIGQKDTTEGDVDNDPDWFEVVAADMGNVAIVTGSMPITGVIKKVDDPNKFKPGGLMGLKTDKGVCIFMTSMIQPNAGTIQYRPNGPDPLGPLLQCYNKNANRKDCEDNVLFAHFLEPGAQIVDYSSGSFALRVNDTNPAQPVLEMASGMAGGDPSLYLWQPVAANVEDMQIAVSLDTSVPKDEYGDVWVNSRDLLDTELNNVRAVRISMVFRSNTQVTGWTSGRRPALEDRPAAATTDGYIRRVMTTVIKLRNIVAEPAP